MAIEINRAQIVDQQFTSCVTRLHFPKARSATTCIEAGLSKDQYIDLFQSQIISRHLDLQARILKDKGEGFYTIGSSGHECNAAVAFALGDTISYLHYRSGAYVVQRSKMKGGHDPIYEQLLSLVASSEDPISGGRHKVFGSLDLNIPPQTSTIASHLPKATGAAIGLTIKAALKHQQTGEPLRQDQVVLASFGDGSANHSTALGAMNAAVWVHQLGLKVPMIYLCEDNGIAISVPTPQRWIAQRFSQFGLAYLVCDGTSIADVYHKAKQAYQLARQGKPVFLHFKNERLLGHAGSDIEFQYQTQQEIEQREWDCPLLHSARVLTEMGWLSKEEILEMYEQVREEVHTKAQRAITRPRLTSAQEIMRPIIPPKLNRPAPPIASESVRKKLFAKEYDSLASPKNMSQNINCALTDLMAQYDTICVFGEDVAKKGGVYRVTKDLQQRFGRVRVFDTLLDEQTILGTAQGFAHCGLLPIPEIQFLAYIHNAVDQIRGEAATISYFSQGQFTNPMVVRIAGLAYQKGFGGHYHNDNALGFLREVPGIIVAIPSRPSQAAKLLRTCVDLAYTEQRVVVIIEPIALYMAKDLYKPGDNLALETYPHPDEKLEQAVAVEGEGQVAIISFGNGAHLSRQAIHELAQDGLQVKLIDLVWLHPLPFESLKAALAGVEHVLIVDECRKTSSLSEALVTWMVENLEQLPQIKRHTAEDCFIPIGQAWQYLLPSKQTIIKAVNELVKAKAQKIS